MGDQRVRIRPEYRLIGQKLPSNRVIAQETVRPRNKVFPIRSVGVTSIMLPPCELAFEKSSIDRRHFRGVIVVGDSEVLRAEQTEHGPSSDGCHVAALMVQPFRITFLRDAIADESQSRCAQRNQLIGVNRQITGILAPKRSLSRTILEEISGHPVITSRAREVLNFLAEIPPVRFGAAFSGGTDQHDRKA